MVKEKSTHVASCNTSKVPFLFRAFELPVALLSFPKDAQRSIVKQLATPFKPVRPKLQQITHNEVKVRGAGCKIEVHDKSRLCAVFNDNKFFITSLDNPSPNADVITFESHPDSMAFNANGTQLLIRFLREASILLTLEEEKVIAKRRCCLIDDTKTNYVGSIKAFPDGRFLIADSNKHIHIFDPSTDTLTELHKAGENDGNVDESVSITPQGHALVLFETRCKEDSLTPEVFDCETRAWSTLPIEITGSSLAKMHACSFNSDRSLLAGWSTVEMSSGPIKRMRKVDIWDMAGAVPVRARAPFLHTHASTYFKPNAPYVLLADTDVRIFSLAGAYVMGLTKDNCGKYPSSTGFSSNGEHILVKIKYGHFLIKWDLWWEELASFFEKPLLLEQYLFVIYLHQLGGCGLTFDQNGVCATSKCEKRITSITSPLTETDLDELKAIFKSLDASVQKYLRIKYSLRNW